MGNNKNIRLLYPQKLSSFLVPLQKHYKTKQSYAFGTKRMKKRSQFLADCLQQEAKFLELKLLVKFLLPQALAFSSNGFHFLFDRLFKCHSSSKSVQRPRTLSTRVWFLTILGGVKIVAGWKWTWSSEWWAWTVNIRLIKKMCNDQKPR